MTIQRLYSLPNCTLLVEGLGDAIAFSSSELRPLLSVVINAECRLAGREKPLSGGRDFLDSLVAAVSEYAQGILSGLNTPRMEKSGNAIVQMQRIDENTHRLSVSPQPVNGAVAVQPATDVNLTTVELFDLVEAVDQLLADTQTLPDLTLSLKPRSRRSLATDKPVAQQIVPAAIGISGLAAAAIVLSLLPIPTVQKPKELYPVPKSNPTATTDTGLTAASPPPASPSSAASSPTASPSNSPSSASSAPDLKQLEAELKTAPEISDPAKLDPLSQQLREKIDQSWRDRTPITQDLVYQVGVTEDGTLKGYKPINPAALENAPKTPLLDLVYRKGDRPVSEPLALFKVVFTGTGGIEVAPWREVMTSPVSGVTEITETAKLEAILPKLKSQINQGWATTPTLSENLIYKVRVKQDGTVLGYSPENDAAARYAQETPLSKLGKLITANSAAPSEEPIALFKVVFLPPVGATEISPWRGWQN